MLMKKYKSNNKSYSGGKCKDDTNKNKFRKNVKNINNINSLIINDENDLCKIVVQSEDGSALKKIIDNYNNDVNDILILVSKNIGDFIECSQKLNE